MTAPLKKLYLYLVTLPDRWYPFASEIEGKWVRGQRSYTDAVERAIATYGPGRLGYKLTLYRESCHFVGSIIFIFCATLISKNLLGSEKALYVLLGTAIIALSFQEFYGFYDSYHIGIIEGAIMACGKAPQVQLRIITPDKFEMLCHWS